jgi:tetratricopeptide (TPR) repeat protein
MAPEQLLAGAVDERTDVFSLGVVLYELLTGELPFQGTVLPAVTDAILHHTPAPPVGPSGPVSAGLAAVVQRCLQKRPEDRYADALALAADLRRVAAGERVLPPSPPAAHLRDPEAHRAYLRGRRQWSKRTRAGLQLAIEQFESAIDRDPEHALAWSGLADCYAILAPWLPPRLGHQKALAAAKRALELQPDSAEAHTSLAFAVLFLDWDWAQSEALFKRALALDPGYATSHQWYAEYLTAVGRFDEALAEARAAEELDALSYAMPTTIVNVFYYARRFEEALEHHRRMVALGTPHDTLGGIGDRARLLEQGGRPTEAVTEYRAVLAIDDDPRLRAGLACALALAGSPGEARAEMAKLERMAGERHVPPYALAGPAAILGDLDLAFAKLEESYATHDRAMVYVRVNPRFDALRGDARFDSILARMNFPT